MPGQIRGKVTAAYENSASCSYLVVTAGEEQQVVDYQVAMLGNTRPEYLLSIKMKRENGAAFFYFDITSRLTLEFILKRKCLKRNEFVRLLADIARSLADCEGYLLKDTGFLLDAGFIYIDPETLKVYMAYIPIRSERNTSEEFKTFIADLILHHANIEEAGSDNFLQRILGFVKRDNFNIGEFLGLLEELVYRRQPPQTGICKAEAIREAVPPSEEQAPVVSGLKCNVRLVRLMAAVISQLLIAAALLCGKGLLEEVPGNVNVTYVAIALIILSADVLLFKKLFYGKTPAKIQEKGIYNIARPAFNKATEADKPAAPVSAVPRLAAQGKTELLGNVKPLYPTLRSRNSSSVEEIVIDKPDFVIGRLPDQVDHVCKNSAVGKVHAVITVREGSVLIRDLNSINGTFVNDSRIESNKDVEIRNNDCIMLANSEYVLLC